MAFVSRPNALLLGHFLPDRIYRLPSLVKMAYFRFMDTHNATDDLFCPPYSEQANKIVACFGSVPKLVGALSFVGIKISRFSVYKWTYVYKRNGAGGNGRVPLHQIPWIKQAAFELGIKITKDDWAL